MRLVNRVIEAMLDATAQMDGEHRRLALMAEIDRRVAAQLAAIVSHPSLQAMTRAWRSLAFMLECDGAVLAFVACSARELTALAPQHPSPESVIDSALYRCVSCAGPFAAVVSLDVWGTSAGEQAALRQLGALAAIVHAPAIVTAAAAWLAQPAPLDGLRAEREAAGLVLVAGHVGLADGVEVVAALAVARLLADHCARHGWSMRLLATDEPGLAGLTVTETPSCAGVAHLVGGEEVRLSAAPMVARPYPPQLDAQLDDDTRMLARASKSLPTRMVGYRLLQLLERAVSDGHASGKLDANDDIGAYLQRWWADALYPDSDVLEPPLSVFPFRNIVVTCERLTSTISEIELDVRYNLLAAQPYDRLIMRAYLDHLRLFRRGTF